MMAANNDALSLEPLSDIQLRLLIAQAAGLHAHRLGARKTRETLDRVWAALAPPSRAWGPDEVATLRRAYLVERLTPARIARKRLLPRRNRVAIVAKVHRLGLNKEIAR